MTINKCMVKALFIGAILAVALSVGIQRSASAELNASTDDGSSLHTQGKNIFETETQEFTLPVKDSSGTAVNNVNFQIWNATKQVNEDEVVSADGQIKVNLVKNHNYIFFSLDTSWQGKTYVWVRDGKLVSTKSLEVDYLGAQEVWSYPEVTQVTLSKRATELENPNEARRGELTWPVLSNQSPGRYIGLTFKFSSDIETFEVTPTLGENSTEIKASLLEDVNYLVTVSSTGGSFSLDPFPIVYKDKSEYPDSLRGYYPLVGAYDHRCCWQITYFDLIRKDDSQSGYNQISNADNTVSVRGIDFTDERTGRTPDLQTKITNENYSNVTMGEHETYNIYAVNTARDENCKMCGNSFTIEIKPASGKIVKNVYNLNSIGEALGYASDLWRQLADGTVVIQTSSLGCLGSDKFVLEYGGSEYHNLSSVLGVRVVDEAGNPVKGVSVKAGSDKLTGTTDVYGYLTSQVKGTATSSQLEISLQDGQKYTVKTAPKIDIENGKITTVDGSAYSGYATVVVNSLNKNRTLKLRAVDESGNPVRGIEFKLVNESAVYADQDVYYFASSTGDDGLATFSLPEDDTEALKFEGDWVIRTSDASDKSQSLYPLKTDHTTTVDGNEIAFTYVDTNEYDGNNYVDLVVNAPVTPVTNPITIRVTDSTDGQTAEGVKSAGSGYTTVLVNGEIFDFTKTTLKAGDEISLLVASSDTSGESEAGTTSTDVNNVTLFKSATIDGTAVSAVYDKSTWTQLNSEWQRRMGEAAQEVDYAKIKASAQNGITTSSYTITGEETSIDIQVTFEECVPVYRLYNMITSEHLFTTQKSEYDNWVAVSKQDGDAWVGEGIAWLSKTGGTPVYRLYNEGLGAIGQNSHYYTLDTTEINNLTANQGWVQEKLSTTGEVFQSGGDEPIFTCYNEALRSAHHYTSSMSEWEGLEQHGWDLERAKNNSGSGFFKCYMPTK